MFQFLLGLVGIYIGVCISFYRILDFSKSDEKSFDSYESKIQSTQNILLKYSKIASAVGFVFGVIDFIAPTPTAEIVEMPVLHTVFVTQRFLGDLVPSVLIITSSLVLNPGLLKIFRIGDIKLEKIQKFLEKYKFLLGILTIIFSFLHWIIGTVIFF